MAVFLFCALLLRGVQSDEKHSMWTDYMRAIEFLQTRELYKDTTVYKSTTYHDPPSSFPCDVDIPLNRTDINVHSLRPSDIKVIGAMGDSLTAAYGALAENIIDLVFPLWESEEARGVSFSVGGDPNPVNGTTVTLPTILMQYESENELVGYSLGRGGINDKGSNLNVAVGGATSYDMPEQALILIERMKSRPEINYYHDWKVVTLFIGGNDLCGSCRNPERFTAQNYINNVRKALDIMHAEKLTRELVNYGRYDTRDDFTVVVQPFFEDTGLPWNEETQEWDDSIMSPDCFHFSELGHKLSAGGLWNNMNDVFKTRLNSDPAFYVPPTGYPPITREPET
uniref:Phospholipase B1, membrane-associated-like n=1 Tax=Saccoglossus kowalevskii TaxID=10224 RepID=A0ABM0MKE7_SACKO|nr:PREDICTED: phospholipase B1, membrane-associated-like [Saccoglossus kowalevskii]